MPAPLRPAHPHLTPTLSAPRGGEGEIEDAPKIPFRHGSRGRGPITSAMERVRWCNRTNRAMGSPIRRVETEVLGDLGLPAIAVRQKLVLIVEEFFVRL